MWLSGQQQRWEVELEEGRRIPAGLWLGKVAAEVMARR